MGGSGSTYCHNDLYLKRECCFGWWGRGEVGGKHVFGSDKGGKSKAVFSSFVRLPGPRVRLSVLTEPVQFSHLTSSFADSGLVAISSNFSIPVRKASSCLAREHKFFAPLEFVLPPGIEPGSQVPQTCILSVELRERVGMLYHIFPN